MTSQVDIHSASYRAYKILHLGFVVLPVIAGVDKFTSLLCHWEMYLSGMVAQVINPVIFMKIVGLVEIAAGILVFIKPRLGALVVMVWLWAIILNLLSIPGYFDIALRDFGLSLGALALANLAKDCHHG